MRGVVSRRPVGYARPLTRRPSRVMCAVAANVSSRRRSFEAVQKSALITAIKTPYLPSGRFDVDAFDRIVEHQISNGVDGLIVGGTTGEGHLMSWDEHIMLIAHCAIQFKDRILVIGNTGSNSTGEAVHASDQGFCVGMDAALHINPYYGKTSVDGMLKHFKVALDCGPGIVYNVPSRTGQDIPNEVMYQLAEHENFLGVKECTGNERIGNYAKKGLKCWSGNDDEAHEGRHKFNSNGHSHSNIPSSLFPLLGVISVTSNLIPGLFSKLMHGSPDYELNKSLGELMDWLFCEPNPIPLNTAMAMCGLIQPVFRLPYVPLNKEKRQIGAKILEKVKDQIPGCQEIRVMEDSEFLLLEHF